MLEGHKVVAFLYCLMILLIMNSFYVEWTRETVIINFFFCFISRDSIRRIFTSLSVGWMWMWLKWVDDQWCHFAKIWKILLEVFKKLAKDKIYENDFLWPNNRTHPVLQPPTTNNHTSNRRTFIKLIKFVNKHFKA